MCVCVCVCVQASGCCSSLPTSASTRARGFCSRARCCRRGRTPLPIPHPPHRALCLDFSLLSPPSPRVSPPSLFFFFFFFFFFYSFSPSLRGLISRLLGLLLNKPKPLLIPPHRRRTQMKSSRSFTRKEKKNGGGEDGRFVQMSLSRT